MAKEKKKTYSNFTNVESMHDKLIPEEFPEGSFGSPMNEYALVEGKSTPWEKGQRRDSAFVYPDRERHKDLPRQADGSHDPHNNPDGDFGKEQ
ncbi:hypothetical protein RVS70_03775 [Virgibacillus sp. M23]|nr:hypothetical protein [Virgibacillus sp. M23]MDY7043316.1 hypothetical protein [Virgibacillus sp. M23]